MFPFSIIQALPKAVTIRKTPKHADFVTLNETAAISIYSGEREIWTKLGLNHRNYQQRKLHEEVYILTNNGDLEDKLAENFSPKNV